MITNREIKDKIFSENQKSTYQKKYENTSVLMYVPLSFIYCTTCFCIMIVLTAFSISADIIYHILHRHSLDFLHLIRNASISAFLSWSILAFFLVLGCIYPCAKHFVGEDAPLLPLSPEYVHLGFFKSKIAAYYNKVTVNYGSMYKFCIHYALIAAIGVCVLGILLLGILILIP